MVFYMWLRHLSARDLAELVKIHVNILPENCNKKAWIIWAILNAKIVSHVD